MSESTFDNARPRQRPDGKSYELMLDGRRVGIAHHDPKSDGYYITWDNGYDEHISRHQAPAFGLPI